MADGNYFFPQNVTIDGDLTLKGALKDVDLTIDLEPLYIDKSTDSVAIGASAQADGETLYIKAGDDGLAVGADATANLILEDSGDNYIAFRQPTANPAGFHWNTGTNADANFFYYYYNGGAEHFSFGLNTAERARLYEQGLVINGAGTAAAPADSETLYVKAGDDGLAVDADAGVSVIIESDVSQGIGFRNPDTTQAGFHWNVGTDANASILDHFYNSGDPYFRFRVNGTTCLYVRPTNITLPTGTDAGRGAAGTAGRVFFNTDDGQLNVDDGTNWTLPDGTTT